jgi:glucose/arabinose dehydrogenase
MRYTIIFIAFLSLFLSGCISSPEPTGLGENVIVTARGLGNSEEGGKETKFKVETVASGLEVPWGFAFLAADSMLFTERPGRVRLIENGKLKDEVIYRVPDVEPSGESGLMDISLHPAFKTNNYIYLAYAYNDHGKFVKIVRYTFDGKTLKDDKIIIDKIPAAPNHAGTRARFGPDEKLYITTGDATDWNLAQKTDSLAGKTLRINDDGSVPEDNPFTGDEKYRPEIWTIGHRNAQGLAWQPKTNLMFQTAHGPSYFEGKGGGGDEVNIVEAGKNYGWPEISHNEKKDGMESPLLEYSPACAPASGMFYDGDKFPNFQGDFFFGCLRGTRIIRVKLDGRRVVGQENLLEGNFGRIREMGASPDGYIYFSTSNRDSRGNPIPADDRILRIVPVK